MTACIQRDNIRKEGVELRNVGVEKSLAQAQMPVVVAAPGKDGSILLQGKAGIRTGRYPNDVTQPGYLRRVGPIEHGGISQDSIEVPSPRPHSAIGLYGHSPVVIGRKGQHVGHARDYDGAFPLGRSAVSQLA